MEGSYLLWGELEGEVFLAVALDISSFVEGQVLYDFEFLWGIGLTYF